jgi:flagellar motor switch protein FliG
VTTPPPTDATPSHAGARTPTPKEIAHRAKDEARDVGYERAAHFLLLIDTDAAANVLRVLDTEEVMGICRAISDLNTVSERDSRRVVEEYGIRPSSIRSTARGGADATRRLLAAAFGAGRAEQLLMRMDGGTA